MSNGRGIRDNLIKLPKEVFMVQLAILLTTQHRLLSLAAILDVFETVNGFYKEEGQEAFFKIDLVNAGDINAQTYGQYELKNIDACQTYSLILVPAFASGDMKLALASNASIAEWLRKQHACGAEIASVCTGAFLLAASGLLDNKIATTHIDASGAFEAAFPMVTLHEKAVVTEDQGIYTSGGATSSFHLLLHLVEKYCDRAMAIRTAKYFAIDMDREQQTCFRSFQPKTTDQDPLVSELQLRIKRDYARVNTVEALLNNIPASRRNLARRFKQVTGNTPIEYLQKTRIEAAKKILEQSSGGVLESMVVSGYSDEKAFRQLFKKIVGMTPSAYRSKYTTVHPESFFSPS